MMKKLLLLLFTLFTIPIVLSQTTLVKGDMAIIGIDTSPSPGNDDFMFVTFEDLDAGTQIYFTDVAADGDLTIPTNQEGHILYTAPTGGVTAGTVIGYQNNIADFTIAAGFYSLANNGDNLTAYQGTSAGNVTTFLHAVSDGSGSAGTFPSGFNALLKLNDDDGEYIGSRSGSYPFTYFQQINNLSNWTVANNGILPFDFTSFTFSTDPIVIVDPSGLSEFQYFQNSGPSTVQSFQLQARNLTNDVTLNVTDFFEISLNASTGFGATLVLSPNVNGRISEIPIYVRLKSGLAPNSYNTSITISNLDIPNSLTVTLQGEVNDRPPILITGVFYEQTGGNSGEATGIEIFALEDMDNLSFYGLGSVNNPNDNEGIEFIFPNVSVSEGTYIYVSADDNGFSSFFGIDSDYIDPVAELDGGDTVLLYAFGDVIDTFGDATIDGVGTSWDYTNSWAARVQDTGPDGDTFIESHWTFGGVDAFNGGNRNDRVNTPFPIGRYEINWRGRTSSEWDEPTNWSIISVPEASDNIKITPKPFKPEINSDAVANEINLKDILTIASGSLTASGDVNGDLGTININSGASLITLGAISGTSHTYTRNTTFDENTGQYSVIGAPVSGANTNILGRTVFGYDETAPFGEDGTSRYFGARGLPMEVGDAFFSAYTGTVVFIGNFNTGTILEPLVYDDSEGEDVAGYNLVSNPYPSAIHTNSFIIDNESVTEGFIYIWDDDNPERTQGTNDDYLVVNGCCTAGSNSNSYDGYIGTAQGFFVKATVADNLEFNNAQREVGNNEDSNFFRTRGNSESTAKSDAELQKIKLNITNPINGLYNSIALAFADDATEGKDHKYDANKLNGNYNLQFYSYLEEIPMAIQGLPELTEERIIPLGMIIGESGEYQINLEKYENIPDNVSLLIHDRNDESYTKIDKITPFNFSSDAVFDENRFNLVISFDSTLDIDDHQLSGNKILILASKEKLTIKLSEGFTLPSAQIEVSDILGRSILNTKIKETFNSVDINHTFATDNIYLVTVRSEVGTVIKKILIK